MIKATAFGALSLLASTNAFPTGCDEKFLRVTLWDSFGDGWGDAEWQLTDPSNAVSTVTVTCDDLQSEKVFTIRPDEFSTPEGDYYMTVTGPGNEAPSNWWELYWKVEEMDDFGPTGVYYEGAYGTEMTWNYDCDTTGIGRRKLAPSFTETWTLTSADNLPDFTCEGCSGEECSKKGKSKKGPGKSSKKGPIKGGKGKPKGKGKGKGKRVLHDKGSSSNKTDSNSSQSEYKYGSRNTDLSVKMYAEGDKYCDGWEDVTRIGAHWYIADSSQTSLFDDGALCEGCAGECNICLGDGSYVFRVTGPTFNETDDDLRSPFKAWEFCHARGNFNDQMNFHVKKGKCYPDDLRWSNEICEEEQESTVTLTGVIAVGGIPSAFFASDATTIILDALAKAVHGWSTEMMSVTTTSLDTRSLTSDSRALRTYTHDVEFTVTFVAEDYSVNGAVYDAVENLIADMSSTLDAAFSSGVFVDQLNDEAMTLSIDILQGVTAVELVSLDVSHIAYAQSHLVYYYSSDEDVVQSNNDGQWTNSLSNNAILALMSIVGVGFIAFVGIAVHGVKAYERVSTVTDSEARDAMDMQAAVKTPFGQSQQKYRAVKGLTI